jgi:DNA polymerase eta
MCPQLIAQHVATWKEGDEKWAYHEDAADHIGTHKVSLDPYRLQSRKIMALIKECLPADKQKVEKASVDEVFLDLSAQVHSILLERFPELTNPPPYDDPSEKLPLPPVTALDWEADALIDLDDVEAEADDPDWDDIAILIGSELIRDIRAEIRSHLGYTCSAGIASNKMLSKLGSGYKKPNQQTVIRNRAVQHFLADMKFTKIRNLGGKLGEQIVSTFGTDSIKSLLEISVEQLKSKLGDEIGIWIYNTIRGIDTSDVNSRTQIKSMLSAKSFRPSINNIEQATKWLRIFAADIFSRLVEEGVLENKRRPKTMNLHHRHGGQTRSRSCAISPGKKLDEGSLFDLAKHLMHQIAMEGRVWPCANLSLSVGGFEDGVTGNMGIGAFLVRGDEARELRASSRESATDASEPPDKRRRVEAPNIQSFFRKTSSPVDIGAQGDVGDPVDAHPLRPDPSRDLLGMNESAETSKSASTRGAERRQMPITEYMCSRCNASLENAEAMQSHNDWHLATDLQEEEERGRPGFASRPVTPRDQHPKNISTSSSKKFSRKGNNKLEQGQSRLNFG